MDSAAAAGVSLLTIDLGAVARNWQQLRDHATPAACGAAVKADAYGTGADRVVPALAAAGCRAFFVATLAEGIAVSETLGARWPEADVFVLNGPPSARLDLLISARLIPVLNSLGDIDLWAAAARRRAVALPAVLHVDTGMSRLGLPPAEVECLAAEPARLHGLDLRFIMTHLACADTPDHPLNDRQRQRFADALSRLPHVPTSFANSAGVFLGPAFHGDLVRPGAALYGVNPTPKKPNPMSQVVRLQGRILQVREIDRNESVGYGASHSAVRRTTIATVAAGYADGFLRSLSNRGRGLIGGVSVPLIGRVSMDLVTFDVTEAPADLVHPGELIELIGPDNPVDAVAAAAGTIGYEILTSLGHRYARTYVGGSEE
ncbi:MAG: alanine racemase [Rhodospirillales bacterium]|nr:MAG: alanine racemase [Rhodospirillales bacterium]